MNNNNNSFHAQQEKRSNFKQQDNLEFEIPLENYVPETHSDRAEAILALMRVAHIDVKNLLTIEAAIAEAADREAEFKTSYARLGARILGRLQVFQQDDDEFKRQKDNLRQRWRRAFERLDQEQQAAGIWLVKCKHGTREKDGTTRPSLMTINFPVISETIQLANFRIRTDGNTKQRSRKFQFEEAARILIAHTKKETVKRLPAERLTNEEKLNRFKKTFINAAAKAARCAAQFLQPEDIIALSAEMMEDAQFHFLNALNQEFNETAGITFDTWENEENSGTPGITFDTWENSAESEIVPSVLVRGTQTETARLCVPSSQEEHTADPLDAALQCLAVLETAGVETSQVLVTKDYDDQASEMLDNSRLPLKEIRERLPQLLEKTRTANHSLILRPKTDSLLQIDDVTAEVLPRLEGYGIFTIETSPNNFQVWLQFEDKAAKESVRDRLFAKLKPTGANSGANGAFRFPGSINGKPKRNGWTVKLKSVDAGRETSAAELEAAELLAMLPPIQSEPKEPRKGLYVTPTRVFPDYARCLSDKGNDRSAADASFVWLSLSRGFSENEIKNQLLKVSEKAREKDKRSRYPKYFELTFNFCKAQSI
jgi:hypothetical protein